MKQHLEAKLASCGQQQVLAFWDELDDAGRARLAAEIEGLDLARLEWLVRNQGSADDWAALARRATGPPAFRLGGAAEQFTRDHAATRGREVLSAGEVGVVLVAGGQATRLGTDDPKGIYPIGPISGASLFQILCEKLLAVSRRHRVPIPLYLMTSTDTHEPTAAFLAGHGNFGLPSDDVILFCQGTMPAVDARSGRLLLAAKDHLALSPDGHGGVLAALRHSGCLADARRRGIRYLFYLQVDNPLVVMCDAELIGYHVLCESEASTQVVAKQDPLDRVGNVVAIDGQIRVIEYSDLPEEAARRRAKDGSLELWAGNTAVHVFDEAFLDRMSRRDDQLPFHAARKIVAHVDASGQLIEPELPNAIKFERFIFDLLPAARNAIAVEVDESTHFAPVKNAPGAERDTPETSQARMIAIHTDWLRQAGTVIEGDGRVEISPLFADSAEAVRQRIDPGARIMTPRYFDETDGSEINP